MNGYAAIDLADFLVELYHKIEKPITHITLQKMLYLIEGEYYRLTDQSLINEDFYAWQHGPVIPCVYKKFSKYAGLPIPRQVKRKRIALDDKQAEAVINTLKRYMNMSPWDLVNVTHQQAPWKNAYEMYGTRTLIPKETIRAFFHKKQLQGDAI